MNTKVRHSIVLSLIGVLIMQLSACGVIIYPERKGQKSGQLDIGVVALDAIGLLFFFIPGIIAFAVDFSTGTIYLPGGSASVGSDDVNVVKIKGDVTHEKIEKVILEQTGKKVRLDSSQVHSREKIMNFSALKNEVRLL